MKIKELAVFLAALFLTTVGQAKDQVNPVKSNQYTVKHVNGQDYFDEITLPRVMVNDKLEFVNVKLKRNSDLSFSVTTTEKPSISKTAATYDPASGTATIPAVMIEGKVAYANVKLKFNPDGTLSVLSNEEPRVDDITRCSAYAARSASWPQNNYCVAGRFPTCKPDQSQINKLQFGMTYDEVVKTLGCHGVLMGRATDIFGYDKTFYAWGTGSTTSNQVTVTFEDNLLKYINLYLVYSNNYYHEYKSEPMVKYVIGPGEY